MYRGCCIEWDCLMMHRIKSVAFSWAPLSLSYTPLPLPPSPPLVHTHSHSLTPCFLLLSFPPFYLSLRLIPTLLPATTPTSLSLWCRLSWTVGHTLLCAPLPNSINHYEGREESVEGGDKKNKNKIWLGKKKKWEHTLGIELYRNSFSNPEGREQMSGKNTSYT